MKTDQIAILDCGGQYTKVIDRRVRELSVKTDIFPIGVKAQSLQGYNGIILSGGPASVWSEESPKYDSALFDLEVPMLGICYGMHLINNHFGGRVAPGLKREYGATEIAIEPACGLFAGLDTRQRVLMSHGDSIEKLAGGFRAGGMSGNVIAAIYHERKPIFGVQFHPEVDLTVHGREMLENFARRICGLEGNYILEDRIQAALDKIREQVGRGNILVLVSGGVDSAVSAVLLLKALAADQLYAMHVDHGFMRKNESDWICRNLADLGLKHLIRINAQETFLTETVSVNGKKLGPLSKVTDPEVKREIIGNLFIQVVREEAKKYDLDLNKIHLAQGTLRPDLIESGNPDVSSYAHRIKTHHNDVDIVRQARARGLVVETNWDWHKDEVRAVARRLGIDKRIADRQPFPGPGLAIRFICHDGKESIGREESEAFERKIKKTGFRGRVLPIKTVGVQGDCRSYRHLGLLYGNRLNADWEKLNQLGIELPGELEFINRVSYALNKTEPEEEIRVRKMYIHRKGLELLREVDALVREDLDRPPVSQVFAVLLPFGARQGYSVAIRTFITNDYMTGRPALIGREIPLETMEGLIEKIESRFREVDLILYDITGKPPATVEWE